MKKSFLKRFSLIAILMFSALAFVACGNGDDDPDPTGPELQSIEAVLTTAEQDEEVLIKGVVFLAESDGFYLSDSVLGKVFVKPGSFAVGFTPALGMELRVQGDFKRTQDKPEIINLSDVSLLAEDQAIPVAGEIEVSALNALSRTVKTGSWYKFVEIVGTIAKDTATNMMTITADDLESTIEFTQRSNTEALEAFVGERVTLQAVLTDYSTFGGVWRLTFLGEESDIVITEFGTDVIEALLDEYFADVIPYDVRAQLQLPAGHPDNSDISITWTSDHPALVDIKALGSGAAFYNVDLSIVEDDTIITLTAVVTYRDNAPFEIDVEIKLIGLDDTVLQLSDALGKEHLEFFYVEALVLMGVTRIDNTYEYMLLQDKTTGETMLVDSSLGQLGTHFEIGDLVQFIAQVSVGQTGTETGAKRLSVLGGFEVTASNQTLLDYRQHAIVVNDHATARSLFADDSTGPVGQFYKFEAESLFFNMSSTTFSDNVYLRWHLNQNASAINDIRHGGGKQLAFRNIAGVPYLGENWMDTHFGISALNNPGTIYPGWEFEGYFYALLVSSEGGFYWNFIIVDAEDIQAYEKTGETDLERAEREIQESIPENIAAGNLSFMATHRLITGDIVWSSSNEAVITDSGVVTYGSDDVTVTLTATFTLNGTEYTLDVIVNVLALETSQLSEVLANAEHNQVVKVEALVVSPLYRISDDIESILIQDKTTGQTVMLYNANAEFGTDYQVGDLIEFTARFDISASEREFGKKTLVYQAAIEVVSSNNDLLDYQETAIVIDSQQVAETAFLPSTMVFGAVYKFTGTMWFNLTSATFNNDVYVRWYFNEATAIADTRYDGKGLAIRNIANKPIFGETWMDDFFGASAENNPSNVYPGWAIEGTFYAVLVSSSGAFYHNFVIISADDVQWALGDN